VALAELSTSIVDRMLALIRHASSTRSPRVSGMKM
jgi:hypothetical protein